MVALISDLVGRKKKKKIFGSSKLFQGDLGYFFVFSITVLEITFHEEKLLIKDLMIICFLGGGEQTNPTTFSLKGE